MKRCAKFVVMGKRTGQVGDPNPPEPAPNADDVARAKFEADAAKAEAARLKKELDEARRNAPTDEQRTRWAELEERDRQAEEERLKKAGEFDGWRNQINEKHQRDLNEERQQRANEEASRKAIEAELQETLVGRCFSDATGLFGPTGRTILTPGVAQSHFSKHVAVVTEPGVDGRTERRVVVKDAHGTVIVDPKTGRPQTFEAAMSEVIDAHPDKKYLLRGSGKVGAGSTGGGYDGEHGVDTSRLKAGDFKDPRVREAVRAKQNVAGGLQIGPGFDAMRKRRDEKA